jgi:eukaryotic-like serine/threonine-protein kinase
MTQRPGDFSSDELSAVLAGHPYAARRLIGRGGAGTVYEVEHTFLKRRFACKVQHRQGAQQPGWADRLRVEAQVMGRLRSPNVVDVVDYWLTPEGAPCIVMELLQGLTLHEEMRRRRRMPAAEALEVASHALSGLAAAHALGIVHRDIKPENLFLHEPPGFERVLKILDFGWARILPDAPAGTPSAPLLPTKTGASVGSPLFQSPEGARGEKVDARADLFSVGLVLYALLGGFVPDFHAGHIPLPSEYAEGDWYPLALDDIVLHAIQARPAARFQTAEEFLSALKSLRSASFPSRPPPEC